MEKTLSQVPRVQLKHTLVLERSKLYGNKFLPECAYCGQGIEGASDMHEVFFTKGDVSSAPEKTREQILNVKDNCVLVHPGGSASHCHANAQTKDGQIRVIRHLIRWCGVASIFGYIAAVSLLLKGRQAADALRLLKEATDELQSMW